jgi:hypothetical protein
LFKSYWERRTYTLLVADVLLLVLSAGVIALFLRTFANRRGRAVGVSGPIEVVAAPSKPSA